MALTIRFRLLAPLALGLLTAGAPQAAILYQETFPYSTAAAGQDQELRNQGWCGGNAGDIGCNNPPGTAANNGGEGAISSGTTGSGLQLSQNINNNPQGTPRLDSFGFWSQTGVGADSFFYTEEFKLQSSDLTSIRWDVRDSVATPPGSTADPQHLAFRIGSNWYISDQIWTNTTSWTTNTVDLVDLSFFLRPSAGGVLPGGNLPGAAGGLALPTAEIDAFGLWWNGPKTATSRIDNFTLIGTANAVPNPSTLALVAVALAALGWAQRRRDGRVSPPA